MKHITTYTLFEGASKKTKIFEARTITTSDIDYAADTLMYSLTDILDEYKWEYTESVLDNYKKVKNGLSIIELNRKDCIDILNQLKVILPGIRNRVGFNIEYDISNSDRISPGSYDHSLYNVNIYIEWRSFRDRILLESSEKTYTEKYQDVVSTIKDICIDLKDDGFSVFVTDEEVVIVKEGNNGVLMWANNTDDNSRTKSVSFNYDEVKETVERVIDYLDKTDIGGWRFHSWLNVFLTLTSKYNRGWYRINSIDKPYLESIHGTRISFVNKLNMR